MTEEEGAFRQDSEQAGKEKFFVWKNEKIMGVLVKLPLNKLQPGMYIIELVDKEGPEDETLPIDGYAMSGQEVQKWHEAGFAAAMVDPGRSRLPANKRARPGEALTEFDVIASPEEAIVAEESREGAVRRNFFEELERAGELYEESLDISRSLVMQAVNRGEQPLTQTREFFEKLAVSVRGNKNALICLGKLRARENNNVLRSMNVAVLGVALGEFLDAREQYLADLALSGFLYDVGKLFVSRACIVHPGKLNEPLLREAQGHVLRGYEYLKLQNGMPQMVLDAALDHHERFDGSGYPAGKKGLNISFGGRILGMVDVFDALTSKRAYKEAAAPSLALSHMFAQKDKDFSPGYVEALISILGVYPPGSLVRLSNKQISVVTESNPEARMQPKVVMFADNRGKPIKPKAVDLSVMPTLSIAEALPKAPPGFQIESILKHID